MTVNLERIFFVYILRNKKYFPTIEPYFFKNPDIQFVYKIIREYVTQDIDTEVPTPKQISEMVKLIDKDNNISNDMLLAMLKVDLKEYNEDKFIKPKFNEWILINRIQNGTTNFIDLSRELNDVGSYDEVLGLANKIKDTVLDATSTKFDSDDTLGSDFDDPEAHSQDVGAHKVKTGWESLDTILGGGWDVQTFNCIMGATNSGKSLWMQNFAVNSANMGHNVLYITLEMSEKKCLKRMGAMRMKIPIDKYDELSKDTDYINGCLDKLHNSNSNSLFSDKKLGKMLVKFYAAGTATVNDCESLIDNIKEKKGINIDLIVVDYITLIAPVKGLNIESNLYMKGKHLAEGLRALGAKYNCPLITGIQVAKDAWNASDITLDKIPESKAIAETADTFFAIIRTEDMKRNNAYRLKLLKQRDGDFSRSMVKFDLNPTYLTIENDIFVDTIL